MQKVRVSEKELYQKYMNWIFQTPTTTEGSSHLCFTPGVWNRVGFVFRQPNNIFGLHLLCASGCRKRTSFVFPNANDAMRQAFSKELPWCGRGTLY
jgi:hypothetical protein